MSIKTVSEDEVKAVFRRHKAAGNSEAVSAIKDVVALLRPGLNLDEGADGVAEMSRRISDPAAELKHRLDYQNYLEQVGATDR